MSRENVEVVKDVFAAFRDRDFDAAAACFHPETEVHPAIVGGPEGVVYRGRDGVRQFFADVDAAWADFRIEPQEFRDLGGEVLVLGRAYARGRGSGIVLDEAAGWVAGMRDGEVIQFRSFTTQAEALEAVGLRE
jgi:ketosteroid isomerase-like protein